MEAEISLPRVRAAVTTLKPYVPGRSIESVQAEFGITSIVKLNQNENPLGPSPRALEAARGALTQSSLYPEGTMPALRRALAERWRVPDDWLLIGNGSDEVFRLLAETYTEPGDGVIVPTPSFAGYRLVGDLMGARVIAVPLAGDTMNLRAMARCAAEQKARL